MIGSLLANLLHSFGLNPDNRSFKGGSSSVSQIHRFRHDQIGVIKCGTSVPVHNTFDWGKSYLLERRVTYFSEDRTAWTTVDL